jgi:glycosyltransferase involved in cell wall biosynthesis
MEQALVSVIVPVYRAERYLRKCVDSILCQTYANSELLLIDDGSPDGCPALCDVLAAGDARIRVFHKANGGAASARNFGLDHMQGEYLLFVDSDDYLPREHINVLMDALKKYNANVSMASVVYLPGPTVSHKEQLLSKQQCLEAMLYRDGVGDYPVGKLFHAAMFRDIRFQTGITSEDFEIFYRLYQNVDRVIVTDATNYYYVQRDDSVSSQQNGAAYFNRLDICERLISEVQTDHPGLLPAAQARAVDESIWLYGITPKTYTKERKRMRSTVKRYAKSVWNDPNVTSKIKRRIFVFSISPLLWTLRMRLKTLLIQLWQTRTEKQTDHYNKYL